MKGVHRLLLVAVAWWLRQGSAPTVAGDCAHPCGGVSVPAPSGLKLGCASSPEHVLHCNTIKGNGEQLMTGNITVREISPRNSTMVVGLPVLLWGSDLCGLPFVGDQRTFNNPKQARAGCKNLPKAAHVVLGWSVGGNLTCQQAESNKSSYLCGGKAYCRNVESGSGYRCFCDGNPYDRNLGCQGPKDNRPIIAIAAILVPVFFIGVGTSASSTWKWRIRMINFRLNGGEHLKSARLRIFTEAELAKATGNYDESNKLGEDGFGSVYRGILEGDTKVEIMVKKPKDVHKPLVKKDFQHELITLMQISTKYVVKLQGICLETRIPILVYEYVSNGSLFEHIHPNVSIILRSWRNRLKIAVEAALALEQIHSCAIIHGNVKSANILLDQNCSVKVSDVGTSVLIPPEQSHIAANEIEGMLGYIDPEYLKTGKLMLKSDVYSFGAVLVELLTGKKPTECVTNSEEPMDIIPYFVCSVKNGTLSDVIDFEADSEEMDEVKKAAEIAVKCLDQSSRKRPAMEEVAQELTAINPISIGKSEGITLESYVTTNISVEPSVSDEVIEQETSSCLTCLGTNSACPSCI